MDPIPPDLSARNGAAEPWHVDGPAVSGGFARGKIAPGFHRSLGLLDVLEKSAFAVKTSPAAALEQFAEILEPLFGKGTPARDNVVTTIPVQLLCHEPARRGKCKDADATGPNHSDMTNIFCGKRKQCPAERYSARASRQRYHQWLKPQFSSPALLRCRKRETRPGGQPDGSSHKGAWGGWALAPNTAFDGEG